ncbi:MAG: conjugal transfer protein TraF [Gammaproteobacteria bacterium]|nr:conjugal transfer protein TraF [Gammaproteobacteria bacterium]
MFRKSLVAASIIAASVSSASAASYGFFDARSVAMGNTSVATGGLTTAAFANPAMLAINESDETFALLIPAVGLQFVDNGGMVDKVDDFQALVDQFNAAATVPEAEAVFDQLDLLAQDTVGDTLIGNASVNTALIYAGDYFTIAGSFRGHGQASAGVDNYVSGSFDFITPSNSTLPSAEFIALGYAAQEVGVSIASDFKFLGM